MAIEDVLINYVTQLLSLPFLLSSLAIGYSLLFFFLYGKKLWSDLSFGEHVLVALGIGILPSVFTDFLANFVVLVATVLNIPLDFNITWAFIVIGFIFVFGVIRASNGKHLSSDEGYNRARSYFANHRLFYPYIAIAFLVILAFVLPKLDPMANPLTVDPLWNLIGNLIVLTTLVLWFCLLLPICLLLSLPSVSNSSELLTLTFQYVFHTDWLDRLSRPEISLLTSWFTRTFRKVFGSRGTRKTKVMLIVFLLILAIYIPLADNSENIFTPGIVAWSTYYDDQLVLTSNPSNQSRYDVLVHASTQYDIKTAEWPIFGRSIPNPSNYSEYLGSAYGSGFNYLTYTALGAIKVTPLLSSSAVEGFLVQPTWRNSSDLASVTVSDYDILVTNKIGVNSTTMRTMVVEANGTVTETFEFSIFNEQSMLVWAKNLEIQGLPNLVMNISGICRCGGSGNTSVYLSQSYGQPPVYITYLPVGSNVVANLTITITYKQVSQ